MTEVNKGQEVLFTEPLQKVKSGNYLGDRNNVSAILKMAVSRLLIEANTKAEVEAKVRRESIKLGKIFLGLEKDYQPMHNWNDIGHIDVFCAKWLGSAETLPNKRMEHTFVKFFTDILGVVGYAGQPGVLPEQWQFQITAIIDRYSYFLVGVDTPTQAILNIQTEEEPGTVNEEE